MNYLKILVLLPLLFNSALIYADPNHTHGSSHKAQSASVENFKLSATPAAPLQLDKPVQITLLLHDAAGKPISEAQLETVHTEKVHALIIDPTLTDYHHKHPRAGNHPGEYIFTFIPRTENNYRIWLDIKPVNGQQAYVIADLSGKNSHNPPVDKTVSTQSEVEGYQFDLTFNVQKLKVDENVIGSVVISDATTDKPVTILEPVMGEFAHIVAFAQDYKTILHIHPMGKSPTRQTDRGGPQVDFHIMHAHPGFVKLFTQVQINGKEIMAPFGIEVASQ